MAENLGYLPLSQFVEEKIGQTELPNLEIDSTVITNELKEQVRDFTGVVTSFGKKYLVSPEDLAKGLFTKAMEVAVPKGTSKGESAAIPGLINKADELFHYPTPTEDDYQTGFIRRYFLQDVRSTEIKEIDAPTYKSIASKAYFRRVKLEWNLNGPSEDQIVGGYKYPGAIARNRDVVIQAEETIPGITEFLSDLKQYVREQPTQFKQLKAEAKSTTVIDDSSKMVMEKKTIEPEEVPQAPVIDEDNLPLADTGTQAAQADSLKTEVKAYQWYTITVGTPSYTRVCSPFIGVSMKLFNQEGDFFEKDGTLKKTNIYLYRTKNEAEGNRYQPIRKIGPLDPINYNLFYIISVEGVGSYSAKIDTTGKLYEIERC